VYSPETVRKILSKFDSIEKSRLASEVGAAWAAIDPEADWYYLGEDVWKDPKYFIDYLMEWRDAFAETTAKGDGLMIDCG
jgi:hypothetical protein